MPEVYKSKSKSKKKKTTHAHKHDHPKPTTNPLAAFSYTPKKAKFVAADSKEKIILVLRRHPITNVRWIVTSIIMLIVPLFLSFLPIVNTLPEEVQLVGLLVWYLIILAYVFEQFLNWYFNVFIVTDERIFDVDFVNLIYREITDANIDQIQDVTTKLGGVLSTLLNYGSVFIQTASAEPMIEFDAVPDPDKVASILRELRVEEEQEKIEGRVR